MTTFNQLGEFGLNQVLARRLTTPGPAPSPTLEPAIFPSLVLESDRPEWEYVKGATLAGARSTVAAVAGNFSCATLVNPLGSNLIVVLNRVNVLTAAGSGGVVRIEDGSIVGTPVTAGVRDGRWMPPGAGAAGARPRAQVFAFAKAALSLATPLWGFPQASFVSFDEPLVIRPNQSIVLEVTVANIGISDVSFQWYERPAQPGEL